MKKINILKVIILFLIFVNLFFFNSQRVSAVAQCTDSTSPVTVTSSSMVQTNFGNLSTCQTYCPSGPSGCSATGVCTYTRQLNTVYPNCASYCSSGYLERESGGYCIPSGAVSCGNPTTIQSGVNVGENLCVDVYNCGQITIEGNVSNISGSCDMGTNTCFCNVMPAGLSCQIINPGGIATSTPYMCDPGGGSPPGRVDLKVTIWAGGVRNSSAFAGQSDIDGPAWAYSLAPYQISWGTVFDADSCTINGTPVSTSGGQWNTLTIGIGQTNATYTLSCSNSAGTSVDTVTIYVPPAPTGGVSSCPIPGNSATYSWTAPNQNVGGVSNWNTFITRAKYSPDGPEIMTDPPRSNNYVGTTINLATTPGTSYTWWVRTHHTAVPGAYSDPLTEQTFVCAASSFAAQCDGTWKQMPNGSGYTPSQPVGAYISSSMTVDPNLSDSVSVVVRGTDDRVYHRICKFFGSECVWNDWWDFVPGNAVTTDTSPWLQLTSNFNILIKSLSGGGGGGSSDWYDLNWGYTRKITVNSSLVAGSSNFSNFPVLVSVTNNSLRHTTNGGNVGRIDGFDILFTSNDKTTKLAHEIERYNPTTGELIAWVKVPSLSAIEDTEIYMYYGNSGASDQQNKTGVWDSNFVGIYHLPDGSTLTANDSTSNSNNGTVTTFTAGNGQIDGGASAGGATGRISVSSGSSSLNLSGQAITISAWVNPTNMGEGSGGRIVDKPSGYLFFKDNLNTTNGLAFSANGAGGADLRFTGANVLTTNSWNYVTVTYNNSNTVIFYVNGSQVSSQSYSTALTNNTNAVYLGNRLADDRTFNGIFDEVRISNVVRSANWIATEYNNQVNPNAFISFGSEETPPVVPPSGANLRNTNSASGWSNWQNEGSGQLNWGRPFTFTDKIGRPWQLKREADNSIWYLCGAPACVALPFNPANSSFSPSSASVGDNVSVYCDYNSHVGSISVQSDAFSSCTPVGFDGKTKFEFSCTANTAGTHTVSCSNFAFDNACPQTNPIGSITVSGPSINTTIEADPVDISQGERSTITWSAPGADSCIITPNNWTGISGSEDSGPLYWTTEFTAICTPTGPESTDSVLVNVSSPEYTLTIIKSGKGVATSTPAGIIDCGNVCTALVSGDETIEINAMPLDGRIFTGWGGVCSGTPRTSSCEVPMIGGDKTVILNFAVDPNYFREF